MSLLLLKFLQYPVVQKILLHTLIIEGGMPMMELFLTAVLY